MPVLPNRPVFGEKGVNFEKRGGEVNPTTVTGETGKSAGGGGPQLGLGDKFPHFPVFLFLVGGVP